MNALQAVNHQPPTVVTAASAEYLKGETIQKTLEVNINTLSQDILNLSYAAIGDNQETYKTKIYIKLALGNESIQTIIYLNLSQFNVTYSEESEKIAVKLDAIFGRWQRFAENAYKTDGFCAKFFGITQELKASKTRYTLFHGIYDSKRATMLRCAMIRQEHLEETIEERLQGFLEPETLPKDFAIFLPEPTPTLNDVAKD